MLVGQERGQHPFWIVDIRLAGDDDGRSPQCGSKTWPWLRDIECTATPLAQRHMVNEGTKRVGAPPDAITLGKG